MATELKIVKDIKKFLKDYNKNESMDAGETLNYLLDAVDLLSEALEVIQEN